MQLSLKFDLPFITVNLAYQGNTTEVQNVLIDTGSANTVFAVDAVAHIGIFPESDDILHRIRGVGGTEMVFTRYLDQIQVDQYTLRNFEIEVGGMDYGFDINGILGMDFLIQTQAAINLQTMTITFQPTT